MNKISSWQLNNSCGKTVCSKTSGRLTGPVRREQVAEAVAEVEDEGELGSQSHPNPLLDLPKCRARQSLPSSHRRRQLSL